MTISVLGSVRSAAVKMEKTDVNVGKLVSCTALHYTVLHCTALHCRLAACALWWRVVAGGVCVGSLYWTCVTFGAFTVMPPPPPPPPPPQCHHQPPQRHHSPTTQRDSDIQGSRVGPSRLQPRL